MQRARAQGPHLHNFRPAANAADLPRSPLSPSAFMSFRILPPCPRHYWWRSKREPTSPHPQAVCVALNPPSFGPCLIVAVGPCSTRDWNRMEPWMKTSGSTAFFMGLVPLLSSSLNILATEPGGKIKAGKSKRPYLVKPLTSTVKARLAKLRTFGRELLKARVPKTLANWSREMSRLAEAQKGVPGFSNPRAYRSRWVGRSWLAALMRLEGVDTLKLGSGDTVHRETRLSQTSHGRCTLASGSGTSYTNNTLTSGSAGTVRQFPG